MTLTAKQHTALVRLVEDQTACGHQMGSFWEPILRHVRAEAAAAMLIEVHRTIDDARIIVDKAIAEFKQDTAPARKPISRIGRRR